MCYCCCGDNDKKIVGGWFNVVAVGEVLKQFAFIVEVDNEVAYVVANGI